MELPSWSFQKLAIVTGKVVVHTGIPSVGQGVSRGTVMGGNAVLRAAERVREKILAVAARELEAHPADLELRDGVVHVRDVHDAIAETQCRLHCIRQAAALVMPDHKPIHNHFD